MLNDKFVEYLTTEPLFGMRISYSGRDGTLMAGFPFGLFNKALKEHPVQRSLPSGV
jgi:hypothetical protein